MKIILTISLIISSGLIYFSFLIAKNEEVRNERFIIAQQEVIGQNEVVIAEKEEDITPKSLTADLLSQNAKIYEEIFNKKEESEKVVETKEKKEDSQIVENKEVLNNVEKELLEGNEIILIKSLPGDSISTWESGRDLVFEFNTPIDLNSFFSHFNITPSEDGKFSGEMNYAENQNIVIVRAVPTLIKGTQYTIVLKVGMKSLSGESLLKKDLKIQFTVK